MWSKATERTWCEIILSYFIFIIKITNLSQRSLQSVERSPLPILRTLISDMEGKVLLQFNVNYFQTEHFFFLALSQILRVFSPLEIPELLLSGSGPCLASVSIPRAPGTNLHGHRSRGQPLGPDPGEPPGWEWLHFSPSVSQHLAP